MNKSNGKSNGMHHERGTALPQAIYAAHYVVFQWQTNKDVIPLYHGDSVHVARLLASLPQTILRPMGD